MLRFQNISNFISYLSNEDVHKKVHLCSIQVYTCGFSFYRHIVSVFFDLVCVTYLFARDQKKNRIQTVVTLTSAVVVSDGVVFGVVLRLSAENVCARRTLSRRFVHRVIQTRLILGSLVFAGGGF